ncbi:MAG TPA: hypothetical protein VK171_08020 [Fimbriimonas sp.]|nr:hypothetical protein [Fimbriimonas sp.]
MEREERFNELPEKRRLLAKKSLLGIGLILLVATAYAVRFEKARQFRVTHEESYRKFLRLEGVEVPPGSFQAPETIAPQEQYSILHLNHAIPTSSDDKGNLILYFPPDSAPEDYKGPKKNGLLCKKHRG